MNTKIWCVGELLIDFICEDIDSSLSAGKHFVKKAGGAPANVAAAISKLGGEAVFVGKVGDDPFGDFLEKILLNVGVSTELLIKDNEHPTTLAFVSLQSDGERDFVFNRGADAYLSHNELPMCELKDVKILHMGSATALLSSELSITYQILFEKAKQTNLFTSFDPNFRTDLWKNNEKVFIRNSKNYLPYADLLKVSEEEALLISEKNTVESALRELHELGAKTILITQGKKGTLVSNGGEQFTVASLPVKSVDSTGAGDAFIGGMLFQLARTNVPRDAIADKATLEKMVAFANKVGAITCTRFGAIDALPSYSEVKNVT